MFKNGVEDEPRFDKYEYNLKIHENQPKMSELIKLSVVNASSTVTYQLLNHLDKFYMDELTGTIYNKISFDYESMKSESPQFNLIQLKIRAKQSEFIETTCILNIQVLDINDNMPQFEKSVYLSHVQLSNDNSFVNLNANESIMTFLLDSHTSETTNKGITFVTKVNAKDIDSSQLTYSITKQVLIDQSPESDVDKTDLSSLAITHDLFYIENSTGIIYLNKNKYFLLHQLHEASETDPFVWFNLQLSVSDSMFTSQARLNVRIEIIQAEKALAQRPLFKTSLVNLNLDASRFNKKKTSIHTTSPHAFKLLNLNKNLIKSSTKQGSHVFKINSDMPNEFFEIKSNKFLMCNMNAFDSFMSTRLDENYLNLPITVCDFMQPGLCDQIMVRINLTAAMREANMWTNQRLNESVISFAYKQAVVTIQQSGVDLPRQIDKSYDDYYLDEAYESTERFYTELRTIQESDLNQPTLNDSSAAAFEFELLGCVFTNLNASYNSSSGLVAKVKQFQFLTHNERLTLQQIKSLFLLNKHNGVLSSRKVINEMVPGVYSFTIRLRSTYAANVIDSMVYKLIILPENDLLENNSKLLNNYFKFSREFYKFKPENGSSSIGQIKLVNKAVRSSPPIVDLSRLSKKYSLIESQSSKVTAVLNLLTLNQTTGQLALKSSVSLDSIIKLLAPKYEFVLYALGSVLIKQHNQTNELKYMCEILLDLKSYREADKQPTVQASKKLIRFGRPQHFLKFNENLKVNSVIYKFAAILMNDLSFTSNIRVIYSIEERQYFKIESNTGRLILVNSLDKEAHDNQAHLNFKLTACAIDLANNLTIECAETRVLIELIDLNDTPPVFERAIYMSTIREDSLPGTVVSTVIANDADILRENFNEEPMPKTSEARLEYFILNGDLFNQFAISSDGKVYSRLMIDRELTQQYTLDIMAFDGRFKALTKLVIQVIDVNDNRPICEPTLIRLELSENITIGQEIYTIKATNPDRLNLNKSQLSYELITSDQYSEEFLEKSYSSSIRKHRVPTILPFSIDATHGTLMVSQPIDYEVKRTYTFYVRVAKTSDETKLVNKEFKLQQQRSGLSWTSYCIVKVNIDIVDMNDNRPVFEKSAYEASLLENSNFGSLLQTNTQLHANDLDSGLNRVITYSILPNTNQNLFQINPLSGLITLGSFNLDRELIGDWVNLTVRATDSGGLYSDCQFQINIIDLNDNTPVFKQSSAFITLQENLPAGFMVTTVHAFDADLNPTTEYYLLNNETNKFSIEKDSGKVFLNEPLDYEERTSFILSITAVDPYLSNIDNSVIKLNIDVLDLNDNAPQFNLTRPVTLFVNENTPANSTIFNVTAFDLDGTRTNNKLEFRIKQGNELGLFGIERETGRLYNKLVFDYEVLKPNLNLSIVIECVDSGERVQLKSETTIHIVLQDVNDNAPMFERLNQTIIFRETFQLGKEITTFQADDLDEFKKGGPPFTYAIIKQTNLLNNEHVALTEPLFSINPNGSLILIKKPLSDAVYIVQVRCYDSDLHPLHSDSYLTIKVADESSNEPKMNSSVIEIVTIGSNEDPASQVRIEPGQLIAKLNATDVDAQDTLFYQLNHQSNQKNSSLFSLNELTGVLKSNIYLTESIEFSMKSLVTDKKFITEKDLTVRVTNINTNCLTNSVYMKLNMWSDEDIEVDLAQFVSLDYLKRFKEIVGRILSSNKKKSAYKALGEIESFNKSDVQVIGLRQTNLNQREAVLPFEINLDSRGVIIEILFAVKHAESTSCLSSKVISKLLNRRKSVIINRMSLKNNEFKFKIIDISYNSECLNVVDQTKLGSKSKSISICSINQAFQNCVLKFNGYNDPTKLCEQDATEENRCLLVPTYEWICEDNKEQLLDKYSMQTTAKTYLIDDKTVLNQLSTSTSIASSVDTAEGASCRKPFNPCKNNAICKQVKIASLAASSKINRTNFKLRIHCFCPNGFKGRFCEEDIDECDANQSPCASHAKCVNIYGSYYCNCSSQPTASCYNTLSPQYSASKSDSYKYYGSDSDGSILNRQELDNSGEFDIELDEDSTSLLFGLFSTNTIRQALLGIFGAICGILIILTLAAGFMCQLSLSKKRKTLRYINNSQSDKTSSLIEVATTINTASVSDGLNSDNCGANKGSYSTCDEIEPASSVSSPSTSSFKNNLDLITTMNKVVRNSKNRSSMTASLISSNAGGYCGSEISSNQLIRTHKEKAKRNNKHFKYSINNILFARLNSNKEKLKALNNTNKNNQIPLSIYSHHTSSESSTCNSPSIVALGNKHHEHIELAIVESNCLLEKEDELILVPDMYGIIIKKDSENDADDEDINETDKPIDCVKPISLLAELKNDMSTFSRERSVKKKSTEATNQEQFNALTKNSKVASQAGSLFKYSTLNRNPNLPGDLKLKATHSFSHRPQQGYATIAQISNTQPTAKVTSQSNTTSFLPASCETAQDDSVNTIEDNSQGKI